MAKRNAQRMMALIRDFLDAEKADEGMLTLGKQKIMLTELFDECRNSVEPILQDLRIRLVIHETALSVDADPESINRVLSNLVTNSAKFSAQESAIEIGADHWQPGVARVWVKDHGSGMSEQELSAVFERFHQGKRHRQSRLDVGSGLGLTICKKLVESHGGKIWAESQEGIGSTFFFTWPISV
jgi:signal transduction histidine kinase